MNAHEPQIDILIELISSGNKCPRCQDAEFFYGIMLCNQEPHCYLICTSCYNVKEPHEKKQSPRVKESKNTRTSRVPARLTAVSIKHQATIKASIKKQCLTSEPIIYPHACDNCKKKQWLYCTTQKGTFFLACAYCGKQVHEPIDDYKTTENKKHHRQWT